MRIALVLHPSRAVAADLAGLVVAAANDLEIEVTIDEAEAERVPAAVARPARSLAADVVLAVGGDGTVLEAAHRAISVDLPVIGVNAGNVGFLAEMQRDEIQTGLEALKSGDYSITERMTLSAVTSGGATITALNDVVVEKDMSQNIIRVRVSADD